MDDGAAEADGRFAPVALEPQQVVTTISFEALELQSYVLTREDRQNLYGSLEWAEPETRCLVGGHPDLIQGDMRVSNELTAVEGIYTGNSLEHPEMERIIAQARDWRLLFQVPTSEEAGMYWGDMGTLYYWIRNDDLKALRFDAAWLQLQCY